MTLKINGSLKGDVVLRKTSNEKVQKVEFVLLQITQLDDGKQFLFFMNLFYILYSSTCDYKIKEWWMRLCSRICSCDKRFHLVFPKKSVFLTNEFIDASCPHFDCGCGTDCEVCTPVACGCQIMESLPMCESLFSKVKIKIIM